MWTVSRAVRAVVVEKARVEQEYAAPSVGQLGCRVACTRSEQSRAASHADSFVLLHARAV